MRATLRGLLVLGGALLLAACAGAIPEQHSATRSYLQQARRAVQDHDTASASAALDEAEGAWLEATDARGNPIVHHERPALRAIGTARSAVRTGNWAAASYGIDAALHETAAGPFES